MSTRAWGLTVAPQLPGGAVLSDIGYRAWTFDLGSMAIAGRVLVNQTVVASRVYIPASFTCTQILFGVVVAGTAVTFGRLALFDEAGTTRLALSDDQAAAFTSVGIKTGAIAATPLTGGPGRFVYAAVLSDGGTPPQGIVSHSLGGGTATTINSGFSPVRHGTQAGQASMPTSLSLTAFNSPYWFALA